ncbi:MAG: 23S rRNA (adenine(2503)-C(2))-methyltransferase RlmN [Bacteroidales bacterium]|nr:23S rRNA (adenine(2503)-C(2))-methyltransferase RlmN [Bacteroidales bacterium]
MEYLYGKTLKEIKEICETYNQKPFAAKQIAEWLYKKNADDISQMTNLSLSFRKELSKDYSVGLTPFIKVLVSRDGTKKYLFQYKDNTFVEAVCIFDKERVTLCISSQAGCKMNCDFCATGKQGFQRNLSSNEILNIFRSVEEFNRIKNIVFMGMGEPLDNWQEVKKTLEILCESYAYGFSPHRITLSSAGYLPFLNKFLTETNVDLAISLHNPISSQRKDIMPIEKAYPIEQTVKLLKHFDWTGQRHLTFEYIVFEGLNNKSEHVNELAKLLNGLPCRINLIPFNTLPGTRYCGASDGSMQSFKDKLNKKGLLTTIRASKGQDIMAACGLLSAKERNIVPK